MGNEWIPMRLACERLGMDKTNVHKRIRKNQLTAICFLGDPVGVETLPAKPDRRNVYVLRSQVEKVTMKATMLETGDWISAKEAAQIIGIQPQCVLKRIRKGEISGMSVHKSAADPETMIYLPRKEVEAQRDSRFVRALPPQSQVSTADIAYWAGMIDGEGSIGIYRHRRSDRPGDKWRILLHVANTNRDVLEWGRNRFGGFVRCQPRVGESPGKWKDSYSWTLHGACACRHLKLVLPHMIIKKYRAELAIEFYEIALEQRQKSTKKLTDAEFQWRENRYLEMRALNKRGR